MINFYLHKKKYSLKASCYNELTQEQLIVIAKLFVDNCDKAIAELKVLQLLLNINKVKFFMIPLEAKKEMLPYISWVFEDKNLLTTQLIPYYNGFYGPSSEWDNLTMKEWNSCEVFYELMVSEEEESDFYLNQLIATIYRSPKFLYNKSKNKDGDIRQKYNPNETEFWARKVSKWPIEIKAAILMWYDGCRQMLVNGYDVFDSSTTQTEKVSSGMFEVIRGLCGAKYGNFENVENLNVHIAMRELELQKKEAISLTPTPTN
jgi:hypothetical protein